MKRILALVVTSLLVSAGAVVGCGSSSDASDPSNGEPNDPNNPDNGFGEDPDASTAPGRAGCSADLQSVVDENGHATACPSDQGCSDGKCVPACQAAATSHGSVGCDFVVATPDFQNQILPPCFAVFLANNWSRDGRITVSRGGTNLDVTTFARIPQTGKSEANWPSVPASGIPAGQVAVLFLSSDPKSVNGRPMTCPVPTAVNAGTSFIGSGRGQAFTIKTDVPVSAYDIHPYGGAYTALPSAELLLPTTAWGTNYIAALPKHGDYDNKTSFFGVDLGGASRGPQWAQVVGSVDGTTVTVLSPVALEGGTNVPSVPANTPTKFTVNAGEYVQWQAKWSANSSSPMEMSGAVLQSDKPIAFVGGNGYLCLQSSTNLSPPGGCDSGHQMIPPVSAFGSEYAVAPYATRRKDGNAESVPYRIVGAAKGTTLTYDPPVSGAPTTLDVGQLVDFQTDQGFVVKSQDKDHPFYIAQMMVGGNVQSGSRPGVTQSTNGVAAVLGDEEFVNVLPSIQYLSKYVFFSDPTYGTTNLVVVRKKVNGAFADVNVDCVGNLSGWKPLGTGGEYETTNVDLVRGGQAVGKCANGRQAASSAGPFGITVWGLDLYASYAYPAGGNVATVNTVVVPPVVR